MVVNNNAAAVLLALARPGREPRGHHLPRPSWWRSAAASASPTSWRESGARLVEVGTTNRTYLARLRGGDQRQTPPPCCASTPATSASSASPSRRPWRSWRRLAHERGLLLLDDLGSGCLLDTTQFGLAAEPTVQESLAAGADLVFFSGDKLLGGPQAGIIVGRRDLVDKPRGATRSPAPCAWTRRRIAALAATLHALPARMRRSRRFPSGA